MSQLKAATPPRSARISGWNLKSWNDHFWLKMMVKSGLDKNILKFHVPLQRYQLTSQANSAFLGSFFCTGLQQLWRGTMNFNKKISRPLCSLSFLSPKGSFQDLNQKIWKEWATCSNFLLRVVIWHISLKCIEFSDKKLPLLCKALLGTTWSWHMILQK